MTGPLAAWMRSSTPTLLWLVPLEVPIDIDAAEARRRAVEELSKAKYAGMPEWVRDLLRRLLEWVDQFARLIVGGGGATGGFPWGLVITVVVLVALIALLVWKVGLPRLNARRKDAAVGADSTQPPDHYRSAADAAADGADWLVAIRERFRAVVRSLEDLTVLDPRPARTAWEVARLATRLVPSARGALDGAATVFNDVMYGEVVATAEMYRQLCGWDDEIVAAAAHADLTDEDLTPVGGTR